MKKLQGLDSIRFLCALIVVLDHNNITLPNFTASFSSGTKAILTGINGCLFNGPAAVIVFFVISGFCIHLPHHNSKSINLLSYFSRRIIRICVPAFFALLIYNFLNYKLEPPLYHVFWSIICELIYYTLYPLLFLTNRKVSILNISLWAYGLAYIISFANIDLIRSAYGNYGAFGWNTWVLGLPCWLMGCWLAEKYQRFRTINTKSIWTLRLLVVAASILLKIIRFHIDSPFTSYVFTLNIFSVLVCLWLGYELVYYKSHSSTAILEWSGRWSYSLYMIHPVIPSLLIFLGLYYPEFIAVWFVWLIMALFFSYLFYLSIERPSHLLALAVSKKMKLLIPNISFVSVKHQESVE